MSGMRIYSLGSNVNGSTRREWCEGLARGARYTRRE